MIICFFVFCIESLNNTKNSLFNLFDTALKYLEDKLSDLHSFRL